MAYNMSLSRQVRYLKEVYKLWQDRSNLKQEHIKRLTVRVSDLEKSREKWKLRFMKCEEELNRIKNRNEKSQKDTPVKLDLANSVAPYNVPVPFYAFGHTYPLHVVEIGIRSFIENGISLRGVEKTFKLFSEFFCNESPSFISVRKWVFRVGLFLLRQSSKQNSCSTLILDHSIENGVEKLLLGLGINQNEMGQGNFIPSFDDATLMELTHVKTSNGEIVCGQLEEMCERCGIPAQIIIDGGSDLVKGVELFLKKHPQVVHTYDIAHKVAALLKHELKDDENWIEFGEAVDETRNLVRQTDLLFVIPPALRTKARYMNADLLIDWANKVLSYTDKKDFSLVSERFELTIDVLSSFKRKFSDDEMRGATAMAGHVYFGKEQFFFKLAQVTNVKVVERFGEDIASRSCKGIWDYHLKLDWVSDFRSDLQEFTQLLSIADQAKKEVRENGLSRMSAVNVERRINELPPLTVRSTEFKGKIIKAIDEEGRKVPERTSMLGMSEIVESVFGKYKTFAEKRPIKAIGEMILCIPLFLKKLSPELIKQALESVRYADVEKWAEESFGKSALSKRIQAFNGVTVSGRPYMTENPS